MIIACRPTVEKMNRFAPQHSRIFKEVVMLIPMPYYDDSPIVQMILVASPSKPFTYTAKNTPRRQAIINEYEKEIETLYTSAERTIQYHTPLPSIQDFEHILPYVRKVVHGVLGQTIGDTDDVFQHGCDRYIHLLPL